MKITQREELEAQEPKRDELETIEAIIAQTEKQATELGLALSRTKPDGIVGKGLQKQIESVNALYVEQCKRRAELQAELGERRLTDGTIGDMLTFARDVREGIANANFDDKRCHIEKLSVHLVVKGGQAQTTCLVPLKKQSSIAEHT